MSLTKILQSPCHKFLDLEEPSAQPIVFLDQIMPLCQNLVLPLTKNLSLLRSWTNLIIGEWISSRWES